jgi:hypothetical protein
MTTKPRREIDWVTIENDYRAGIKSNVQIAKEHGISEKAIRKKAKEFSWVKDLAASIRAMAQQKVREQQVRDMSESDNKSEDVSDDAAIIEENANIQAAVIRSHRKDLGKAREITQLLFEELQQAILNPDQLEEFARALAIERTEHIKSDETRFKEQEKLMAAFTKIMELPSKAGVVDKLASTLDKLIKLERTVFGINDDSDKPKDTLESFLQQLPD